MKPLSNPQAELLAAMQRGVARLWFYRVRRYSGEECFYLRDDTDSKCSTVALALRTRELIKGEPVDPPRNNVYAELILTDAGARHGR